MELTSPEEPAPVLELASPEELTPALELSSLEDPDPALELASPEEPASALEPATGNGTLPDAEPVTEEPMQQFLDERCVVDSEHSCTARDLYIAYVKWCDENQHRPELQRTFGVGLSALGLRRKRQSQGRHLWEGIGLKTRDEG